MPLSKFAFRPGINNDVTAYSNEGGWIDGDKVRFRLGFPEKMGGWVRQTPTSFLGACRSLHTWASLNGDKNIGVGTSSKFYVNQSNAFYDITPIRATSSAGSVTFSATDGSSEITVSHTSHGAVLGDFVTFSGAATLGGTITANVLNQEYYITELVDENSYKIQARAADTSISSITVDGVLTPSLVTANSSDTGDGGASVVGEYQINVGLDTEVVGTGWGAGTWSADGWGDASSEAVVSSGLRLWSQDNFGEDLLFNARDGNIYYWNTSLGTSSRAVALSTVSGASKTPTVSRQILVSDRDRHIISFGCDPEATPGVQDPLVIRFSSQESLTDWQTLPTNSAGELRLGSGSEIIAAVETRQQVLVFTDTTLYTMQYLGDPTFFGINAVSENITIASFNAAIAVDDTVFWMGEGDFYAFTGAVQRLPCTVRDHVFNDFNKNQYRKVSTGVNAQHSEIWWFYPSASSATNDKYVVYNYAENVWYYGALPRTAWVDQGVYEFPIAASTDNYLYFQENGLDDGSSNPASAITSYITSAPVDIGDGENFVLVKRLMPDVIFRDSTEPSPVLDITTRVRNKSAGPFNKETSSSVSDDTELVNLRLRGRQMSVDVRSDLAGTTWRLGTLRYDIRPDGRR